MCGAMSRTITVVTVCYNAEDTIKETIESVISQSYEAVEYIIVDGGSTDGTLGIINSFVSEGHTITLLSEKDKGLYDAMNKGTAMATGEYVIFMNSGDVFADRDVISDISGSLGSDIVYGNVIRVREDGNFTEKYAGRNIKWLLLKGLMICHQTMFIRTEVMRQYQYNLEYRITADFNFLCRCIKDKRTMHYVDRDIVVMDNINGISTNKANLDTMRREDDRSIRDNFPIWYQLLRPVKYIKRKLD